MVSHRQYSSVPGALVPVVQAVIAWYTTPYPMQTVAFQGASGAYSDLALRHYLGAVDTLPCGTFEEVFAALAEGEAARAFIPIENSIAGRVADIHHLLPRSGCSIVGEHFEPIRHQLLGIAGTRIADIREVHSHVHALGQCRQYITEHGFKGVVHADTAGAARDVAAWGDPSQAAIASVLAGERYGLETLAADIEDAAHNTTRFLLLSPVAMPYLRQMCQLSQPSFVPCEACPLLSIKQLEVSPPTVSTSRRLSRISPGSVSRSRSSTLMSRRIQKV